MASYNEQRIAVDPAQGESQTEWTLFVSDEFVGTPDVEWETMEQWAGRIIRLPVQPKEPSSFYHAKPS